MDTFFKFGGCNIFYKIQGKGEAVLLIHGMLNDHRRLDDFSEDLVKAGFKTILIDLPLHGKSTGVLVSVDGLIASMKALMTYVGVKTYHCVGFSLGASIGSVLAKTDSRVKSFTAIAPVVTDFKPLKVMIKTIFSSWRHGKFSKKDIFRRLFPKITAPTFSEKDFEEKLKNSRKVRKRTIVYDMIWDSKINCGLNLLYSNKPVMIVMGKFDAFSPWKDLDKFVSGLSKVVMVNKGHIDLVSKDLKRGKKNILVEFLKSTSS